MSDVSIELDAPDKFDPEGSGFDDKSAAEAKMIRNDFGHMGSVRQSTLPERKRHELPQDSYLMLKGRQHETWHKAVEGEGIRGFRVLKRGGRYWSVPEDFDGDDEEPFLTGEVVGRTKQGRPVLANREGGRSTELRAIVEVDGKQIVIPTIFGGKQLSIGDATQKVIDAGMTDPETGREIRSFDTVEEARAEELRIKAALDIPENEEEF